MKNVIVIGGGAAGMMAAISARRHGGKVTLLERNNRLGKKILATGNGRCNYTNINLSINNYHGQNHKFAYGPLNSFNVENTIEFFEELGITPAIEDGGKVFPLSFQASSVLDALRFELEDLGVEIITEAFVKKIIANKDFTVILANNKKINGQALILAPGGKASPNTGSDGNGYNLAKDLNHKIEDVFPGLVQLHLQGDIFKSIQGVKFIGQASLFEDNKIIKNDFGDILFTSYGISGPPILQLSRHAMEGLRNNKKMEIGVSIINKDFNDLYEYLNYRFNIRPNKTIEIALIGLINKRLIIPILKELNIDKNKLGSQLTKDEIKNLTNILIMWKFEIIASNPFKDAQITVGGVSTDEINSSTLESKLIKNLYFAGEIMDIDGDCGGFNLQWAWSTGYIAGEKAALNS